jgi:hypothetical protein
MVASFRRVTAGAVVAALLVPALPASADRVVRCESRNYRYNYCRVDTDNRVQLMNQYSRRRCVLWQTWGYDRRGIWVDQGCGAEFRAGRDGISGGEAAVAGAIVGGLILGSILANKDHGDRDRSVPSWAIGTFRGWDEYEGTEWELTITRNGAAELLRDTGYRVQTTGRFDNGRLYLGDRTFTIARSNDGFRLRDERSREQVEFWRVM